MDAIATCQCGKVKVEAIGRPILTASCYCMSCQDAKGHWVSMYCNRLSTGAPPLEMRVMTGERRVGGGLPDDVPNHRGHSVKFMLKLVAAWIAMGFRRPQLPI